MSTKTPTLEQLVMAIKAIPFHSPVAQIAVAACLVDNDHKSPHYYVQAAGYTLERWQAKILEAQIMAMLGEPL